MSNRFNSGTISDVPPPSEPPRRRVRIRFFITIVLVATMGTIAVGGWHNLYKDFLETNAPVIKMVEAPRGVGLAPVTFRFELHDAGAGLDEYVVRLRQRGRMKELQRKELNGAPDAVVEVPFTGDKELLEEGTADLEIRAFDRSLWNTSASKVLELRVDYRKPKIEVISSQHNSREGGSQLLFYRAFDESAPVSGVRVGSRQFLGIPARGIDRDFEDPSLYVAVYAIGLQQGTENLSLRAFAEDQVGNANSTSFYYHVQPRGLRAVSVPVREDFLREEIAPLAALNFPKIQAQRRREGVTLDFTKPQGTPERLIEELQFVNKELRAFDDLALVSVLKDARFERYWEGPFQRQPGSIHLTFGDKVSLTYQGQKVDEFIHRGYTIDLPRDQREVIAANDGIVSLSDNIGTYGRMIAVDHGLGVVSIYAQLEQALVQPGARVIKGQVLGLAGRGGLFNTPHVYFEMRVQGIPVDPGEWMDAGWYNAHVDGKIDEVKRTLGIAIRKPLE